MLDWEALRPDVFRPLRRTEYEYLAAVGTLEGERVELLRGTMVATRPPTNLEAWITAELNQQLIVQLARVGLGEQLVVRARLPFAASDVSEPEPDLAVVPRQAFGDPHPDRAMLVIEVADSSLRKDRDIKRDIYAEAGVPEYLIVDVEGRAVDVHTEPRDGSYRSVVRVGLDGELAATQLPGVSVRVAAILR